MTDDYYLPRMPRADPMKQCATKIKYFDVETALEGCHAMALREQQAGRAAVIRPYICPYCRELHVGRVKVS